MLGVHLPDAGNVLFFALRAIQNAAAAGKRTTIDASEVHIAVTVADDLEHQRTERSRRVGLADHFFITGQTLVSNHGRNIHRAGQIVNHGVEQGLNADMFEGRPAQDGLNFARDAAFSNRSDDFRNGGLFFSQHSLHQHIVEIADRFEHVLTGELGGIEIVFGDRFFAEFGGRFVGIVEVGPLSDQVDRTDVFFAESHRQLQADGVSVEPVANFVDHAVEVGSDPVEFIDKADSRDVVSVGLEPDGFGLGFDAAISAEYDHGSVEYAKGPFDFDGEVHVAGGVDQVQRVSIPFETGGRRCNRDSPLLFLFQIVHNGCTVMHFPDFVGPARKIEHALRDGGLASVNMGANADVSDFLEGVAHYASFVPHASATGLTRRYARGPTNYA